MTDDTVRRAAEALGRRFTLIQPHARDIAQALADAGLLVSEQEAQERDRAAAATALLKAADALNEDSWEPWEIHGVDEAVEWLQGRADRLARQGLEQEGRR